MRGVDDDGSGFGNFFHHLVAQAFPPNAANARLHLRIAFRVLELVADLLLAHAQVLVVAAALAEQIHRAENQEDATGFP